MYKISVIIPVYNGARTIIRSISSVLNQTYNNVELIVVNDGSTDNTENLILEAKQRTNACFKYIKIENGGLANARNVGWAEASGDYCCNLDADDFLDVEIFDNIFKTKSDFDVCYYGFRDISTEGTVLSEYSSRFKYIDNLTGINAAIKKLKRDMWICQGSAIYRRDLMFKNGYQNIPGINQGEDMLFITSVLTSAQKVVCVNTIGVNIECSNTSMMHSPYNDTLKQCLTAIDALKGRVAKYHNIDLNNCIDIEYLEQVLRICKSIINSKELTFKNKVRMLKYYQKNHFKNFHEVKSNTNKQKMIEYYIFNQNILLYYLCTIIVTKIR